MVHGLEADYWGRVDFVYIDREAAANQDVVQRFGIRSQPIFIFLSPDGTEIERFFGYLDETQLRASLDSLLEMGG